MIPTHERRVSAPIVELPPYATASSIADMLIGSWSGGDYSSDITKSRNALPVAFATVTIPLALIEQLSGGLFSVPDLLENNTLCALAGLGMSSANRENLTQRVVTGKNGFYMPPRFQAWVGTDSRPAQTCEKCEWEAWRQFGVRAILCPYQIPFVSACFHCGNTLTKRAAGAEPPSFVFKASQDHAVKFAHVARRLAADAHAPSAVRERLLAELSQHGYVHAQGGFRSMALSRDFGAFCNDAVSDLCLRRLTQYPRRINRLLRWIQDEKRTVHPVFVILLDWFLQDGGQYGSALQCSVRHTLFRARPNDWALRTARFRDRSHVDHRKRYDLDDLPALVAAGCTRTEIGHLIRLAPASVSKYMEKSGLRELHARVQLEAKRSEARERWIALEQKFPMLRPYALGTKVPHLLTWLWRHDRDWLGERVKCFDGAARKSDVRRVDRRAPKGHYASLAARIRRAARQIRESEPVRWCSVEAILRETGLSHCALGKIRKQPRIGKLVLGLKESRAEYLARKRASKGTGI